MTRPHSTLAEPTATFIDALSGSGGTADPVLAPPVTDFFGDATADPVIRRDPVVVLAVEQVPDPAAAAAPVSTAAAPAPRAVPAPSPTPAQRQPVPGIAPRRPAGVAPERVAVAPGHRMPLRYSAPQYAPQNPQPPQYSPQRAQYSPQRAQYSPQSSRQRPPPRPQGAAPRGQWPPPAAARAPQRAVAQRPGQARPAAASYSSFRQPQSSPRTARPGAPTAKGPGKTSSKAAAGWSVFLAIILFLLFSGAGREVLDALAELLNR